MKFCGVEDDQFRIFCLPIAALQDYIVFAQNTLLKSNEGRKRNFNNIHAKYVYCKALNNIDFNFS